MPVKTVPRNSRGSSAVTVAARDLLYFFYDRLVSLVHSDMSIAEKASVAREVWAKYKWMSVQLCVGGGGSRC